jgi:hypothetical protein
MVIVSVSSGKLSKVQGPVSLTSHRLKSLDWANPWELSNAVRCGFLKSRPIRFGFLDSCQVCTSKWVR